MENNSTVQKKYTFDQLENTLKEVVSLSFTYLDKAVKELNAMDLKEADKFSDTEKQKFNFLHTAISIALDVTYRSYPVCYDLFPESKENLDNAAAMFQRFQEAGLLKKKENASEVEPKKESIQQKSE